MTTSDQLEGYMVSCHVCGLRLFPKIMEEIRREGDQIIPLCTKGCVERYEDNKA